MLAVDQRASGGSIGSAAGGASGGDAPSHAPRAAAAAAAASTAPARGLSLILDCGDQSTDCGYCRSGGETSSSHGMQAYRLTVYDYQDLIDQGWRRSGKYLYKMHNDTTCCRHYTIRLPVAEFESSRGQRKVLRKWERFLAGEDVPGMEGVDEGGSSGSKGTGDNQQQQPPSHQQQQEQQQQPVAMEEDGPGRKRSRRTDGGGGSGSGTGLTAGLQPAAATAELASAAARLLSQAAAEVVGAEVVAAAPTGAVRVTPPAPKFAKRLPPGTVLTSASALALAAAAARTQHGGVGAGNGSAAPGAGAAGGVQQADAAASAGSIAVALASAFNRLAAAGGAALTAAAAGPHLNFSAAEGSGDARQAQGQQQGRQQSPQKGAYQREGQRQHQQQKHQQQQGPHQQQQGHQQQEGVPRPPRAARRFEVTLSPSRFSQESYDLYRRYQMAIHGDPASKLTPAAYTHFLVDSPLERVAADKGPAAPPCGYGSFHQHYRVDGRLVAVGVVDVLPRCLSSVYLYWDPDYAPLAPGRFSALLEIEWVAQHMAARGLHLHTNRQQQQQQQQQQRMAEGIHEAATAGWLAAAVAACHASSGAAAPAMGASAAAAAAAAAVAGAAAQQQQQQPDGIGGVGSTGRRLGSTDLRYYYMGFYIHDCPKMRYKAEYHPSELLCPQAQTWVRIDGSVTSALDAAPLVALSRLPGARVSPNLALPLQQQQQQQQQQQAPVDEPPGQPQQHAAGGGGAAAGSAAAAAGAVGGAAAAAAGEQAVLLPSERRPLRWRVIADSGLLPRRAAAAIEGQIREWRALVGPVAATAVYMLGGLG